MSRLRRAFAAVRLGGDGLDGERDDGGTESAHRSNGHGSRPVTPRSRRRDDLADEAGAPRGPVFRL